MIFLFTHHVLLTTLTFLDNRCSVIMSSIQRYEYEMFYDKLKNSLISPCIPEIFNHTAIDSNTENVFFNPYKKVLLIFNPMHYLFHLLRIQYYIIQNFNIYVEFYLFNENSIDYYTFFNYLVIPKTFYSVNKNQLSFDDYFKKFLQTYRELTRTFNIGFRKEYLKNKFNFFNPEISDAFKEYKLKFYETELSILNQQNQQNQTIYFNLIQHIVNFYSLENLQSYKFNS